MPPWSAYAILGGEDRLSDDDKASASALTSMSVLHLTDLEAWLAAPGRIVEGQAT